MQPFTPPPPQLTQLALQCHPAQQLYLLGSTEIRQKTTSVFRHDHPSCTYTSHYFLLSLVRAEEEQLNTLQDKMENTLAQHLVPCTVLVLNISQFNRWLIDGHPFAWTIIRKATLLHNRDYLVDTDFPVTPLYPGEEDIMLANARRRRLAKLFLHGAAFYQQRGDTDLAAFMLHQCAEQCLRILLKTTTGYCPHTHNIDKLLRYCCMTVHKLTEIFNTRTPEQERLYRILRNAYIDARYKILPATNDDITRLTRKVKTLMSLLKDPSLPSVIARRDDEAISPK